MVSGNGHYDQLMLAVSTTLPQVHYMGLTSCLPIICLISASLQTYRAIKGMIPRLGEIDAINNTYVGTLILPTLCNKTISSIIMTSL